MKKITFLIAIAIIAAFQLADAAQPVSPLAITPTVKTPTIDGDGSDATWTSISWQPINVRFLGEEAGFDADGSGDCDATMKITYDYNNLYLLIKVDDDIVTQDAAAHWVGDKVEIYFGLAGYLITDNAHSLHTRQFDFAASTNPNVQHGQCSYAGYGVDATDGIEFGYTETATGYMMEVSLNRAIALESVPNNTTIAFDISIADNDILGGAGVRNRKSWFNSGTVNELWNDFTGAGKLTLNGNTALSPVKQSVAYCVENNLLKINTDENTQVTIVDISGKQVLKSENSNIVNISTLNNGVYFALVKKVNGEFVANIRFVK